jgi:hypothetical protein
MSKRLFLIGPFGLILILMLLGCKKNQSQVESQSGFSWVYKGNAYQSNCDTAFSTAGSSRTFVIMAGTGFTINNLTTGPTFNLNSLQPGSYSLDTALTNSHVIMNYMIGGGEVLYASAGTFTITTNSANKLSGNFSATLTTGFGNEPLIGTFKDIPVGN